MKLTCLLYIYMSIALVISCALGEQQHQQSGQEENVPIDQGQPLLSCDVCAVFAQELRISIARQEGAYIPTSLPLPMRLLQKYMNPFSETFCFRRAYLKVQYYLERGLSHLTVLVGVDSRDVSPSSEDLKISNAVAYHQWANMGTSASQTLLQLSLRPSSGGQQNDNNNRNGISSSGNYYYLRLEPAICEAYLETVSQFTAHLYPAATKEGRPQRRRGILVGREAPADRESTINDDAYAFKAPPLWVLPPIIYNNIKESIDKVLSYLFNPNGNTNFGIPRPPSPGLIRQECDGCVSVVDDVTPADDGEIRQQEHHDGLVEQVLGEHLFGDSPLLSDPSIPNSCYAKLSLMTATSSTDGPATAATSKVDEELLSDTTTSPLLSLLKLNAVVGTSIHLLQEEFQQAFPIRMLTSDIVQLGPTSPSSTMEIICKPSPPRIRSTLRSPNPSAFSTAMCHDENGSDIQGSPVDDDKAINKWLLPIEKRDNAVSGGIGDISPSSWLATSWFTHDVRYYKNFYMELFEMSIKLLRRENSLT